MKNLFLTLALTAAALAAEPPLDTELAPVRPQHRPRINRVIFSLDQNEKVTKIDAELVFFLSEATDTATNLIAVVPADLVRKNLDRAKTWDVENWKAIGPVPSNAVVRLEACIDMIRRVQWTNVPPSAPLPAGMVIDPPPLPPTPPAPTPPPVP